MEELVRVTENDAERCRRKLQALESDVQRLEESRSSLLLEQEQTRKLVRVRPGLETRNPAHSDT